MNRRRRRMRGGLGWYALQSAQLNGVGPSLYHDYVKNLYYSRVTGATAFPFTAVRTTNATMFNAEGNMVWAPANMIPNSETTFSSGLNVSTSVLSDVPSPTGSPFYKLICNNGSSLVGNDPVGGASLGLVTVETGKTHCISFYAKAGEISVVRVREPSATGYRALIDLVTGIVTTENGTAGLISGMVITSQNVGSGIWRIICKRTASGTSQGLNIKQGGTTGDGVSGVLLTSPQFEIDDSSAPKVYNATTGTAYYGPRLEYNPASRSGLGLLNERISSNMLTYSNDLNNATGWPFALSIARTTGESVPDGTALGALLTVTVSSGARLETNNITIATAQNYTFSVFLKAGTSNGALSFGDGAGTVYAYVKATLTGSGSVVTGGIGASTATIREIGSGWYRVTLSYVSTTTGVRAAVHPWSGIADQFGYPAGAIGSSCAAWGVQMENYAFATSLIPTFGVTATRSAESIAASTGLSSLFPSGFALYVSYMSGASTAAYPAIICIGDGISSGDEATIFEAPIITPTVEIKDAGVLVNTTAQLGTGTVYAVNKIAATAGTGANANRAVKNGGAVSVKTPTSFPTLDRISYGNFHARNSSPNADAIIYLREVRIYPPVSASDAQLQSLTI